MKRLFAKKTANMADGEAKNFALKFKALQEKCETMAKMARKIKQLLKNPKKISDAKQAIKTLYNGNNSFISYHIDIINLISKITENFENYLDNEDTPTKETLSLLQKTKNLFSKIKTAAKKISPSKVATALKNHFSGDYISVAENESYDPDENKDQENPLFDGHE